VTAVIHDILVWAFLVAGSFFLLVGGIGVLRLPDFFTRMHAAGVTDTLGAVLVLVGLMIESGVSLVTGKLILILFFLLFTSPTASHATAHAALISGLKPWVKPGRRQRAAVESKRTAETAPRRKSPGKGDRPARTTARKRKGGRR